MPELDSAWDRFAGKVHFIQCDEDDEPQRCILCGNLKSKGKQFPLEHETWEFICDTCWLPLSLKMLQTSGAIIESQAKAHGRLDSVSDIELPFKPAPNGIPVEGPAEQVGVTFNCGVCDHTTTTLGEMMSHVRSEHGNKE